MVGPLGPIVTSVALRLVVRAAAGPSSPPFARDVSASSAPRRQLTRVWETTALPTGEQGGMVRRRPGESARCPRAAADAVPLQGRGSRLPPRCLIRQGLVARPASLGVPRGGSGGERGLRSWGRRFVRGQHVQGRGAGRVGRRGGACPVLWGGSSRWQGRRSGVLDGRGG